MCTHAKFVAALLAPSQANGGRVFGVTWILGSIPAERQQLRAHPEDPLPALVPTLPRARPSGTRTDVRAIDWRRVHVARISSSTTTCPNYGVHRCTSDVPFPSIFIFDWNPGMPALVNLKIFRGRCPRLSLHARCSRRRCLAPDSPDGRVRASFPASRPRVLAPRRASATAARGYHYVEPLLWPTTERGLACGGLLDYHSVRERKWGGKTPLHELGQVWRLFSTPCAPRRRANHLALLLGYAIAQSTPFKPLVMLWAPVPRGTPGTLLAPMQLAGHYAPPLARQDPDAALHAARRRLSALAGAPPSPFAHAHSLLAFAPASNADHRLALPIAPDPPFGTRVLVRTLTSAHVCTHLCYRSHLTHPACGVHAHDWLSAPQELGRSPL
ncbi:hypothetical protein B0H14DRAFT_3449690 [Mycena olivaceomarginata]|nr:hypothetical protein B0H14DRAFT_3449690 [Mycena olivaceomarginata]